MAVRHARSRWLLLVVLTTVATAPSSVAAQASAQASAVTPQTERPLRFDAAGRILVITPTDAARWKLAPPYWPLGADWSEARLFATDTVTGAAVLVAQRVDGARVRYAFSREDVLRLRSVVDAAVVAMGTVGEGARGSTGLVLSEPAGNVFVRNQTALGLSVYGAAAAAILSGDGAAAGGGYLLTAGATFFIAARTVRNRPVTRAQTILSFHGGTRGAAMGAAVAALTEANGGPGYGTPILVGALGGTLAGYQRARSMSDGEAASSGFAADLAAVSTLGLAGALGAFDDDSTRSGNHLPGRAKLALGSAIGAAVTGYVVGPRYARRAAYNVTAGDIDVTVTSAFLGALAASSVLSSSADGRLRAAVMTTGLLSGALVADRTKVRHADRTSADGKQVQLGAIAGSLMGGGLAAMAQADVQPTLALTAVGGMIGLALADHLVRPGADAGPKRGVLTTGSVTGRDASSMLSRVSLSVVPAATSLALGMRGSATDGVSAGGARRLPLRVRRVPVVQIAF